MSERYQRLFTLPGMLSAEGAPIVIMAGALLKDNATGKLLAQLKFQNSSPKEINSIAVSVRAYDASGAEIRGVQCYNYTGLTVSPGESFGSQTAIEMPDENTSSISVEVASITYKDNSVYDCDADAAWTSVDRKECEKTSLMLQRNSRVKVLSLLPIILTALGILLQIVSFAILVKVAVMPDGYLSYMIFKQNLIYFILAFVFPIICIISVKHFKSNKLIKCFYIASIILIALQALAIVLYTVLMLRGPYVPSIIANYSSSGLALNAFSLVKGWGRPEINLMRIASILSDLLLIGKNIVCILAFKKMLPKKSA